MIALMVTLAAAEDTVQFVGEGAQVLAFDGAGQIATQCASPCEVPLLGGPQRFVPGIGGKPLTLDQTASGKTFRVHPGAPTRRGVGLIVGLVGMVSGSAMIALDAQPDITVGAVPYFTSAAISLTGLGLQIRSRPRFVEEEEAVAPPLAGM